MPCRLPAWPPTTLPVAVTLKRFLALDFVFILGISISFATDGYSVHSACHLAGGPVREGRIQPPALVSKQKLQASADQVSNTIENAHDNVGQVCHRIPPWFRRIRVKDQHATSKKGQHGCPRRLSARKRPDCCGEGEPKDQRSNKQYSIKILNHADLIPNESGIFLTI